MTYRSHLLKLLGGSALVIAPVALALASPVEAQTTSSSTSTTVNACYPPTAACTTTTTGTVLVSTSTTSRTTTTLSGGGGSSTDDDTTDEELLGGGTSRGGGATALPSVLSRTGSDLVLPAAVAGGAMTIAGIALTKAGRRRRETAPEG